MLPDELEYSQIAEMDEANARGNERPEFEGLQVYSYEQVRLILEWIDKHLEPAKHAHWLYTSDALAHRCSMALKRKCPPVRNLALKTAMRLSGYEPTCAAVEVWHFKFTYNRLES